VNAAVQAAQPLLERWLRLEPRVRLALGGGALAVVAIAVLAVLASRDTRVTLFANPLWPDQVAEVDAQLSAWNVAFAPQRDNVRVDAKRRAELLARLALAGVPHGHVVGTSEALATVGSLTPQVILDAQARAGLEGDLEKGLRGLGGIADARVIIAPAHGGVFADDSPTPPSASVRVSAQPGQFLTESTLGAVRAFVAAGVPGLEASRVTVIDDRGAYDAERPDDGAERQAALQSALDAAFGAGTTIVRVHVERNDRASESHDVRRAPQARGVIARRDFDERMIAEKKRYTRRQTTEDRGSDVHDERTLVAAGGIARVSIAVIVDARRGLDLDKIREVAAAAGGFDARRGDALSVEAVPFDRAYGVAPQPFAYTLGFLGDAVPAIALAVVAIVAIRAGSRPLLALAAELARRFRLERSAPAMRGLEPDAIAAALRGEPPHVAAAIIGTLATPLAAAVLDLYAADERRAIVARLARARAPLLAGIDFEALLR
jgi:flagellar M-ring protein FliF